jgi:hypothetical protein
MLPSYALGFGKYRGWAIARVPADYLRRLTKRRNIGSRLREAAVAELERRRHARYYQAQQEHAREPLGVDLDAVEVQLCRLLLDTERKGIFRPGPHLDVLWDLIAAACVQRLYPEDHNPSPLAVFGPKAYRHATQASASVN